MKTQKYYIYMKSEERNQIIAALNKLRNRLLEQGKYTDTVDDTLNPVGSSLIYGYGCPAY